MLLSKVSIKKLEIQSPPIASEGGRILTPAGEIAQIINGTSFIFLAYIEFQNNPQAPRGNHYHEVKNEYLYIVKGRLRAIYHDVDSGAQKETFLESGNLINIKPRCAHVYFALEYTQAIEFSPNIFDPNDTKEYFFEID